MRKVLQRRYGRAESRDHARRAIRPGARGMADREAEAYRKFENVLMDRAGISREAAARVIRVYAKNKVLDRRGVFSSGQLTVKHGGFLDKDVILRALAQS